MQVSVVDYGSGNLQSVKQALISASSAAGINADINVTDQPDAVAGADAVVLPGVGAFGDCMAGLEGIDGMRPALEEATTTRGRPFLGICVGMQLMAAHGNEGGYCAGLDWIDGGVDALTPDDPGLKIPHMGWNSLEMVENHPLWAGVEHGSAVYFLHSYAFTGSEKRLACTDYGGPVVAAIGYDNKVGLQFHPEKSQAVGQRILANWLNWKP
ncbi:MAG: imidazole glycerol phosphate synthase subunit HisH [SAR116 cluster bacterium MED-G04]|jgi:glutamine amidotransferase|nr:imidazole glycerol phosphate synthase subunit HisH [SAR116 cluster bacterium]OUW37309.1 MAG: imidazole glycerol phosphate synthase subunit HisH [Gammaproteobacteria bacterium TMED183]PDH62978.1 MAG: imidazole glycerol phosphate synthase subunit HisH [SAR116 cluster bacterium MED-G04]CAI8448230.1 MAG: Imidazole glycerol phosphate synthase subunit HisH [SAR116 cluster bacterium MED-G04]